MQRSSTKVTRGRRSVNGSVRLRVPRAVIKEKCARYCERGKPAPRTPLVNSSDLDIVATYGAEYRGIVQYYLCATKRSVISPAQRAEIGGDISGSDG